MREMGTLVIMKKQIVYLFVPSLMFFIAMTQIVVSHRTYLTPWKGGGFGMFSTVESSGVRFIKVYLTIDDEQVAVPLPDTYDRYKIELQTFPREWLLNEFLICWMKNG